MRHVSESEQTSEAVQTVQSRTSMSGCCELLAPRLLAGEAELRLVSLPPDDELPADRCESSQLVADDMMHKHKHKQHKATACRAKGKQSLIKRSRRKLVKCLQQGRQRSVMNYTRQQ